jgi:hypothetical protein
VKNEDTFSAAIAIHPQIDRSQVAFCENLPKGFPQTEGRCGWDPKGTGRLDNPHHLGSPPQGAFPTEALGFADITAGYSTSAVKDETLTRIGLPSHDNGSRKEKRAARAQFQWGKRLSNNKITSLPGMSIKE